ncbi:MAG: hypothetical protein AB1728_09195 [Bacteroidota bacterium]
MKTRRKNEIQESGKSSIPARVPKSETIIRQVFNQKMEEVGFFIKEEIDRQIYTATRDIQDILEKERQQRRQAYKLIYSLLIVLLFITTAVVYYQVNSETSIKNVIAKELSIFEDGNKKNTESLFLPIKQSVEKNLNRISNDLELNRTYIDIFALEGLSRNGSRLAFQELVKMTKRGGDKARFASIKVNELKNYYSILSEPKKQNVTLGELSVLKANVTTTIDALNDIELIYLLSSPSSNLSQIHHIMTILWNKEITKDMENELWNILQNSQNLAATIATCSLLHKNFGAKGSIYDFAQWKAFLESRM